MHCVNHNFTGLTVDGGFADYVLVRERSVIKLPEGLEPAAVAPHADAGLTAYHAIRRMAGRMKPGTTAVVMGIGGVGHIAVQLARELGSSRVIAIDTEDERLALARELGADEAVKGGDGAPDAVRELTDGRGADVVFDFVGTDATHATSMAMLANAGTFSVIGYGGTFPVPSLMLVSQEQSVVGNLVGSWTDLYELIQLHAAGRLTLRVETHPFESINDVLDKLRAGGILGRAVLVPE
jgi:NAD+-dependent secondary alcohol dehydrogenase Adh1